MSKIHPSSAAHNMSTKYFAKALEHMGIAPPLARNLAMDRLYRVRMEVEGVLDRLDPDRALRIVSGCVPAPSPDA